MIKIRYQEGGKRGDVSGSTDNLDIWNEKGTTDDVQRRLRCYLLLVNGLLYGIPVTAARVEEEDDDDDNKRGRFIYTVAFASLFLWPLFIGRYLGVAFASTRLLGLPYRSTASRGAGVATIFLKISQERQIYYGLHLPYLP